VVPLLMNLRSVNTRSGEFKKSYTDCLRARKGHEVMGVATFRLKDRRLNRPSSKRAPREELERTLGGTV
jgi:hypothetical protein